MKSEDDDEEEGKMWVDKLFDPIVQKFSELQPEEQAQIAFMYFLTLTNCPPTLTSSLIPLLNHHLNPPPIPHISLAAIVFGRGQGAGSTHLRMKRGREGGSERDGRG